MTEPYILTHPHIDVDALRLIGITCIDENGYCRSLYDIINDLASVVKYIISNGESK